MGYQEQQGETTSNFPPGTDPFVSGQAQSSGEPSPELESDASLENGQLDYSQQAQDQPEPTFDTETDASNGLDVTSPEYKHFQAAFTRARQNDKPNGRDIGAELDEIRALQARQQIEREATEQPASEIPAYTVNWQNFRVPQLSQDSPLAGHEDAVLEILKPLVEHVLDSVNQQGQHFVEQSRAVQARDYITEVVEEIGNRGGPNAKTQALSMLKEYRDIARATPQKWARFVVNSLGLNGTQSPGPNPSSPAGNPQRMAQQVKSQGTRPSAPSAAPKRQPVFKGRNATAQAVAYALEQQLSGR